MMFPQKWWWIKVPLLYGTLIATSLASYARADLVAYTFVGANIRPEGGQAGGYFMFDPSVVPTVTYPYLDRLLVPVVPNFDALQYPRATYSFPPLPVAVDDDVFDLLPPSYGISNHARLGGEFDEDPYRNLDARPTVAGQIEHASGLGVVKVGLGYNGLERLPPHHLTNPTQSLGQAFAAYPPSYIYGFPSGVNFTVVNPTVSQFSIHDVMNNAKSVPKPAISVDGKVMTATFTPHVEVGGADMPMAIEAAAVLMGVDHFNWVNWIVNDTSPTRMTKNGVQPPIPYLDPPLGGWDYEQPVGADNLLAYFDEGNAFTNSYWHVDKFTDNTNLRFEDAPVVSAAGYVRDFETFLAGVSSDGGVSVFGSYFKWRATSLGVEDRPRNSDVSLVVVPGLELIGVFPVSALNESQIAALARQGIRVVVPEPHGLILIGLGWGFLLPRRSKRSNVHNTVNSGRLRGESP